MSTTTTHSSHRNLSPPPQVWAKPSLVVKPASLPDFPCLSYTRRVEALRHKTLVHITSVDVKDPKRSLRQELASHKRWEIVGDAFLRFCLYRIFVTRYPGLTAAGMSVSCCSRGFLELSYSALNFSSQYIANELLDNKTLSWLAWHYGLFDSEMLRQAQTVPGFIYNQQKPAADLFEAWLGAASEELPEQDVTRWLESIFSEGVLQGFADKVASMTKREHDRLIQRKINGPAVPGADAGASECLLRYKMSSIG